MPVLRVRTESGGWAETLLNRVAKGVCKVPPLRLGPEPDSPTQIHLPFDSTTATLVGSPISVAYSFVLQTAKMLVNGRAEEGLRVLRHGDRVALGTSELHYLDFAVRPLAANPALTGEKCTLSTCTDVSLKEDDEYVMCPWCGNVYHASCWMALEQCAGQPRGCYPVRRILEYELRDKLKPEKLPDWPEAARVCRARCQMVNPRVPSETIPADPMSAGSDYLPCPNPGCRAPYHIQCWLRMRGTCPACDLDFANMFDKRLDGSDKGGFAL